MRRRYLWLAMVAAISLAGGGVASASAPPAEELDQDVGWMDGELDGGTALVEEDRGGVPIENGDEVEQTRDEDGTEQAKDADATGGLDGEATSAAHPDLEVTQYAGPNRYITNTWINQFRIMFGRPVFVATGTDFADALSVAPVAAKTGGLLVLTPPNEMPWQSHDLVKLAYPSKIYIIGGTGAVSQKVAKQLDWIAPVERIAGANRYETSYLILQKFFTGTYKTAFVATGANFPDALSAAAAAGAKGAPVILVDGQRRTTMPAMPLQHMVDHGTERVVIVGGTGVVHQYIGDHIGDYFPVRRLGGGDRYATNMLVNGYLNESYPVGTISELWLATGKNFPDALSAAGPAGHTLRRLVLSNGTCIPQPVVSGWIDAPGSQIKNVYLAGGSGVLSESVRTLVQCP